MITVPDGHGGSGLGYEDVDGDKLALFTAVIPGVGAGVNIRTSPRGCSVAADDIEGLINALRVTLTLARTKTQDGES